MRFSEERCGWRRCVFYIRLFYIQHTVIHTPPSLLILLTFFLIFVKENVYILKFTCCTLLVQIAHLFVGRIFMTWRNMAPNCQSDFETTWHQTLRGTVLQIFNLSQMSTGCSQACNFLSAQAHCVYLAYSDWICFPNGFCILSDCSVFVCSVDSAHSEPSFTH